jgi:hypothetical protein
MRVRDPDGVEWNVTRRWLEVPAWRRARPRVEDLLGGDIGGDDLLAAIAVLILVAVLYWFGIAFLLLLAALVVALVGLAGRILLRRPWLVETRSERGELAWRVRGALGSRRAVHEIAKAFVRGDREYMPRGAIRVLPEPILRRSG